MQSTLVRSLLMMATIGLGLHLLLPQLAGLRATGEAIARASWWIPVGLVVLETASLAAYARLLDIFLAQAGATVDLPWLFRVVLVGNSLGRALPGGTGAAFAIIQSAMHRQGHDPVVTATAMGGAGVLSTAVLAALLPVGVAVGLVAGHLGPVGVPAAVVAITVVVCFALLPRLLRRPDRLATVTRRAVAAVARGPLRTRLDPDRVADGTQRGTAAVHDLLTSPATLRRAVLWAAANWLLDVAVVMVLALTVGAGTPVAAVLVGYVVAQIAAAVPLTPGGVGVVETAMIGSLVAAGAPAAAATATVLGWRLVSHWLPIPVGLALMPTVLGQTSDDTEPPRA